MKTKLTILLFILLICVFPDSVFANTKLQCSYRGILPGYDTENSPTVTLIIRLEGETDNQKNAIFSSTVTIYDESMADTGIDSCKENGNYNQCLIDYWTLIGQPERANKNLITFGDAYTDTGNNIVNILTTNSSNKYVVLEKDKAEYFVKNNKYSCPDSLVVLSRFTLSNDPEHNYSIYIDKDGFNASKCDSNNMIGNYMCKYVATFSKYTNPNVATIETTYDGGTISSGNNNSENNSNENNSNDNNGSNINFGNPVEVSCDGIIGKELLEFFNKIFRWIQILAPIYVIIIGAVEFAGAVLQDDKDAMKKATSKFIKRLLIAVALFFIPLILGWLLGVFNDITGAASSTCGIGG